MQRLQLVWRRTGRIATLATATAEETTMKTPHPDPAEERLEQGYPRGEVMPYPLTDDDTEVQCPRCGTLVQPGAHSCLPQTLGEEIPARIAKNIEHARESTQDWGSATIVWLAEDRSRLLTVLEEKEKEEMEARKQVAILVEAQNILVEKLNALQSASVLQKEELEELDRVRRRWVNGSYINAGDVEILLSAITKLQAKSPTSGA